MHDGVRSQILSGPHENGRDGSMITGDPRVRVMRGSMISVDIPAIRQTWIIGLSISNYRSVITVYQAPDAAREPSSDHCWFDIVLAK